MKAKNIKKLEAKLRETLSGEVRFDEAYKALYASDASNYRQEPIGVVVPQSRKDLIEAVRLCREFGAPVLARGAGTSLAGQGCNFAVVLDTTRYFNRILDISADNRTARIEPGVVLDRLNDAARPHGLTFGPDPATHSHCTLGGMIGNNSCGVHSMVSGKTADNVISLEVMTYDGQIFTVACHDEAEVNAILSEKTPRAGIYSRLKKLAGKYEEKIRTGYPILPRRVSGYNLDALIQDGKFNAAAALTGTEGTCVFILEAVVKLVELPAFKSLFLLGYEDICHAADDVPWILNFQPSGLEGIDQRFIENMKKKALHSAAVNSLPAGQGWLLVEFSASNQTDLEQKCSTFENAVKGRANAPSLHLCKDSEETRRMWQIREAATGATVAVPGEKFSWSGWEDAAVSPEHLGAYLRDFYSLLKQFDYRSVVYGHFGDGCIHARIDFCFETQEGIRSYRQFMEAAADLVARYKGSFSGEHGDGHARAELLGRMFGPDLIEAFREFKSIWDPANRMNPGKIVEPYKLDEHLKIDPDFRFRNLASPLQLPHDKNSFGQAVLKCIGVGKCRKTVQGTMCPSFRATGDEMHSTRGRARLLFEMAGNRDLIGEQNENAVKESLDLCLSCKACKTECPTGIDMSAYKSIFLYRYFKKFLRPPAAYFFGHIDRWARLGSLLPALSNAALRIPGMHTLFCRLLGLDPTRNLPHFSSETYQAWARRKSKKSKEKHTTVLLWADTFNNYFTSDTAKAAHEFLESAGFEVLASPSGLCCGRPLYDFGMLDEAKDKLVKIIAALDAAIEKEIPVIFLEPGCLSVFRDELVCMLPDNPAAGKLATLCISFTEFVTRNTDLSALTAEAESVDVHGHCHQKALWGMQSERELFGKIGRNSRILENGCCGMAGAFGFQEKHKKVSDNCAEESLAAIRKEGTVISDGFSCREQMRHKLKIRPLHTAEFLNNLRKSKDQTGRPK